MGVYGNIINNIQEAVLLEAELNKEDTLDKNKVMKAVEEEKRKSLLKRLSNLYLE